MLSMPPANRSALRNRLLAALPQEDFDRSFSNLQPVPLILRQVILEIGAPLEHVYFIEQGVASVLVSMENGSTIEVGMIGFDGAVGVPALLGAQFSAQQVIVQI